MRRCRGYGLAIHDGGSAEFSSPQFRCTLRILPLARPSAQGEMSSRKRIQGLRSKFDSRPFHLDKATAQYTIFRGLAASGWHTAAMTMRRLVDGEIKLAAGLWVPVRRIPLATSCATRGRAAS